MVNELHLYRTFLVSSLKSSITLSHTHLHTLAADCLSAKCHFSPGTLSHTHSQVNTTDLLINGQTVTGLMLDEGECEESLVSSHDITNSPV